MKNLLSILVFPIIAALLLILSPCGGSQESGQDGASNPFDCSEFCSFTRQCESGTENDWINCKTECDTYEGQPLDNPIYACYHDFSDYPDDCAAFHECAYGPDDDTFSSDDDATAPTWTDSSSGLTWEVVPSGTSTSLEGVKTNCENLSLDGHEDWRLPTISELRSLIRGCPYTEIGGDCEVSDNCLSHVDCLDGCDYCENLAGPGSGGAYWPPELRGIVNLYWSSSLVEDTDAGAWSVDFKTGGLIFADNIYNDCYGARCVRP